MGIWGALGCIHTFSCVLAVNMHFILVPFELPLLSRTRAPFCVALRRICAFCLSVAADLVYAGIPSVPLQTMDEVLSMFKDSCANYTPDADVEATGAPAPAVVAAPAVAVAAAPAAAAPAECE